MKGLSEGFGFNPMDSLEKIFTARGLDKSHPELFERIENSDLNAFITLDKEGARKRAKDFSEVKIPYDEV